MSKIIAIANQKGGVGKTTTCINLAAGLALQQHSVLLIDLDPQGNATMGSGISKKDIAHTSGDVLLGEALITDVIVSTKAGYDLLPTNRDLTAAEISLLQLSRREQRLMQALSQIKGRYDYILIDCPPSLNMLTLNALIAADSVLIPMQCEYYSLEGLTGLLETLQELKNVNTRLKLEGIVRTMYDGRNSLANEVSQQLIDHFGEAVFDTVIPRNVRVAEAPSHGLPVVIYDKNSSGAIAYQALAQEMSDKRKSEFSFSPQSEVAV